MENNFDLCYNSGHETFREPDATGEAAPTSNPVAKKGHDLVGGGSTTRILRKFRFSMAAGLSEGRGKRLESESLSRSSCQTFRTREKAIGEPFAERPCSFWLQHRSLDHAPCGRSNSQVFWNSLSSQPPLATSDGVGMELPKARTSGSGKGRGRDRTLEEETLAGNKKKPSHLEPIWPSSMRVDFCSFPMFAEHGRRGDKLPSCIISTGEKESRPSRPLLSRPSDDTWRFTSNFKGRILRPQMWRSFCAISRNTSVGMLFSYGIELSSIGEKQSMTSWIATQDSMWNGFPDMPRSSIRLNLYGPRRNADWPIALLRGQRNSSECWIAPPDAFSILNVSSGLVSGHLNCLGKDNKLSISYA